QEKILPELEIVAKAQAVYDMGMGIPPTARVIKDGLTGKEVVVCGDKELYHANGGDDFLLVRAIFLRKPENLPEWVIKKCWDKKMFCNELNKYVNQATSAPLPRVVYWISMKAMQSIMLRESGPEAVLGLTQRVLLGLYLETVG
ncbi:MAG: hypothetical protein ACOX6I_03525, partial [Syntrophomonadaceae bacterium]